mmetsp:Transcript_36975/g.85410  ORF Transcript_36975/g.85410 Transcript_36975/m.85410 type:complete len:187 (+) Transcript_36975:196-756(+)|eukprot:CAMPEP_0182572562 /NCGR_PEP_ID=MMETSP1324-20130603/17453_1 /TAXON_ID=236786 /ORGANISM="Florenciella sp., Strain RCC1587" /LENGTH=186 /DNA_ID=CAMNT_0024787523 /DNA_START=196 /DNA_END=756 /DNA_ORIENTATION=-
MSDTEEKPKEEEPRKEEDKDDRRDDRDDRREDSRDRGRSRSRDRSRDRRDDSRDRRDDSRDRGGGGGDTGMEKGIACRWNDRGFGFIKPNKGGDDVFCHVSAITDGNCLREGDEVEFKSVYDERKGKERAERVIGGRTEERGGYGKALVEAQTILQLATTTTFTEALQPPELESFGRTVLPTRPLE